jgi:hypothetical protein
MVGHCGSETAASRSARGRDLPLVELGAKGKC